MKPNLIKIGGLVCSILSVGVTLAGDWFADKKLDAKIAEKVAEALKDQVKGS